MQRTTLAIREVVTLVVRHEVDNRPLGQGRWLVQDKPPVLDSRSEWAHVTTVRVWGKPGKRSGDTLKRASYLPLRLSTVKVQPRSPR